jgi:hypothetical protein
MWHLFLLSVCHSGAMELGSYVNGLGREFATLAEAGGEESRALVEKLAGSLESAIRMAMLDVLSGAADEISREMAPGGVELRLRGRDPEFMVSVPPPDDAPVTASDAAPAAAGEPVFAEDGPAARINVRLPEQLKAAVEEAAAKEGRSVNAWLVRAAAAALPGRGASPRAESRPGTAAGNSARGGQRLTGWVR